jgi:hypothetical protein
MKKGLSRNAIVMIFLWLFAISLSALVLILMNIRGPLINP